ncbi:2-phosphosulfolactate phosphatase [Maritalea myrionectae]|uniref:Probable 2-phosphosulfolactate phosphatase n=1 Tax=Maritalea myrionectae TaxID=454601 RepID=A0A2R4MGG9_9HYPH|nr:2-phosphosulfolactate phosphatase [Maritalea myrionectae]AVX04979.1 2-phosphosulfolactate phosphatase [Maritalea myrionectae]
MRVHLEWGEQAVRQAEGTAIIVDCLSSSTALTVACGRAAEVFPFGSRSGGLKLAQALDIDCVGKRDEQGLSLSPPSLDQVQSGQQIVLPSPNGSNLSTRSTARHTLAGSLRNAKAVGAAAMAIGEDIVIVAAGERWHDDGSLRPAFEDQLAAGAIAAYLSGILSPEAKAAMAIFEAFKQDVLVELEQSISGQELIGRGFHDDVRWASQLNASDCVPRLQTLSRTYEEAGMSGDDMPPGMTVGQAICFYSGG